MLLVVVGWRMMRTTNVEKRHAVRYFSHQHQWHHHCENHHHDHELETWNENDDDQDLYNRTHQHIHHTHRTNIDGWWVLFVDNAAHISNDAIDHVGDG